MSGVFYSDISKIIYQQVKNEKYISKVSPFILYAHALKVNIVHEQFRYIYSSSF